jgi:hypothetical protein
MCLLLLLSLMLLFDSLSPVHAAPLYTCLCGVLSDVHHERQRVNSTSYYSLSSRFYSERYDGRDDHHCFHEVQTFFGTHHVIFLNSHRN